MSDSTGVVISDDVSRVIDSIAKSVRGAWIIVFANDIAGDHRRVRHGIVGDREPGRDHGASVVNAGESGGPGARNIDGCIPAPGQHEPVSESAGVVVVAYDIAGVVKPEDLGIGGAREVDGGKMPTGPKEAMPGATGHDVASGNVSFV